MRIAQGREQTKKSGRSMRALRTSRLSTGCREPTNS